MAKLTTLKPRLTELKKQTTLHVKLRDLSQAILMRIDSLTAAQGGGKLVQYKAKCLKNIII